MKRNDFGYERICSCCGKPMSEGYCIGNGEDYYCSDDCLHTKFTREEYEELYEADEAYWTEWEEEFPVESVSTLTEDEADALRSLLHFTSETYELKARDLAHKCIVEGHAMTDEVVEEFRRAKEGFERMESIISKLFPE